MHLDFDAPPQVRAGLNMTRTALLATVYYAVKCLVAPDVLPNAGLARPITVAATDGSVINCSYPAAVNGRCSTCQRVVDLIFGALAPALPERVIAATNGANTAALFAGSNPDGSPWIYLETIGGGSGARATKDGMDGVQVHMTNTSNLPVEALETEYPLTLLRYELVNGSGGAGAYRGGMGLRRVYRAEKPCRLRIDGSRFVSSPWGLEGGLEGSRSFLEVGDLPYDHGIVLMQSGDVVGIVTAGAGGYGPPAERDPDLVARDVAEGRLTGEAARAIYPQATHTQATSAG